jgi:hypothetical protein
MADIKDFRNKNTKFTGTDSIEVPKGTTAERSGTELGQVRYNTDLGFLEQYNATGWAGIDAPPVVTNQTGIIYSDTDATITIDGSNFKSGSLVYITGAGVSGIERALVTTFISSSQLTAATNASSVNFVGGASYGIKVINPSGLSAILDPAGNINRIPTWTTGAGSLATIYDAGRTGISLSVNATDADGETVTYALQSGSLPSGLSLNTSNGAITGNASAVGSDTTSNFTIRATAAGYDVDRSFSITVKAPVTQTFSAQIGTFTPQSWTAPAGVTRFNVYMWGAAGGTGANNTSLAGGAGGYTEANVSCNAGTSFGVYVGQGGFYSDQNGGGGGYTGLFVGASESASNCIAIAGGGGGMGTYGSNTNGGGSSTPDSGYGYGADQGSGGAQPSCGGSCSSDGSWPFGSPTFTGLQFRGGWGCGGNIRGNGGWPGGGHAGGGNGCNGGAGGGGWYGGGGGGDRGGNGAEGNGGSGYVAGQTSGSGSLSGGVTVNSGSTTRSSSTGTPPQTGNTYYPGSGVGYACNVSGAHGTIAGTDRAGPGYLVIVY